MARSFVGSFLAALILMPVVASAGSDSFFCDANGVAIIPKKRISMRCASPAPGGIVFFDMSLKNKVEAPLAIQVMTAAVTQNKDVQVVYDPDDLSGEKIGCNAMNCRLIQLLQMVQ
jgi:hypothetical protein